MFRRHQVKTHSRLMREELNETLDHLRMAAAYAADGASVAVAPRVDAARRAVQPGMRKARGAATSGMGTVLDIARDRSRQTGKRVDKMARKGKAKMMRNEDRSTGRRWPLLIGGVLATGVVIGAAGAFVKRRRNQRGWDEYGSTRTNSDTGALLESAKSTMDASVDKAKTLGESAKERGSDLIGSKNTNNGPTGEYGKQPMSTTASATKNSRP